MASPPSVPTRSICRPASHCPAPRRPRAPDPALAHRAQEATRSRPASLLSAADELAALIDQAALAGGVDWNKLDGSCRPNSPPTRRALASRPPSFLDIVMRAWPKFLKEARHRCADASRLAAAEALFTRWAQSRRSIPSSSPARPAQAPQRAS
jgi:inactivated superfamily I helicase